MKTINPNIRVIDLTVEELVSILQNADPSKESQRNTDIPLSTRKVDLNKLCEIYPWPRQTVYGWVNQRYIPCSKVGKHLMFDLDEIEKWIESNKIKSHSEK